jgi:hypothetical protein
VRLIAIRIVSITISITDVIATVRFGTVGGRPSYKRHGRMGQFWTDFSVAVNISPPQTALKYPCQVMDGYKYLQDSMCEFGQIRVSIPFVLCATLT